MGYLQPMTTMLVPTAPWRSQGFAGFQGIDPPAMDGLVRLLEQAAFTLLDHRQEMQALLLRAGISTSTARRLMEVEDWLAAATDDVRRRQREAEAAADPLPTPTSPPVIGPPVPLPSAGPVAPPVSSAAPAAPATTAPPVPAHAPRPHAPVLSRAVGPTTFALDGLSGKGLSGYAVVGLSYRHLGVETRTVTTVYDDGDGWRRTVVESQRRGVFEVRPGLGWENIGIVHFRPRRWYNPWAGAGKVVTSSHE